MSVTKRRTIEDVDLNNPRELDAFMQEMFTEGMARVRAESDELRRKGILDENGKPLLKELPADMPFLSPNFQIASSMLMIARRN
jgi:hypothetical protein